jgi:hypothetical protein
MTFFAELLLFHEQKCRISAAVRGVAGLTVPFGHRGMLDSHARLGLIMTLDAGSFLGSDDLPLLVETVACLAVHLGHRVVNRKQQQRGF